MKDFKLLDCKNILRNYNKYKLLEEYKETIAKVDKILDILKVEKGFDIIKLRYFEQNRVQDVANKLHLSESTYNRYHKNLINLFSRLWYGLNS